MTGRRVHVIGAHGRSGQDLCRALSTRGDDVVPIVRRHGALPTGLSAPRIAALEDEHALRDSLKDAQLVVSTANAQFTQNILHVLPGNARLVAMGSTRVFTQFPDAYARHVQNALHLLAESRTPNIMLLPSMIYGSARDITTRRLLSFLKRLPIIPLPNGGRALIQPIHQADVTTALLAAIDLLAGERYANLPTSIVIAGPEAVPYAHFVYAVLDASRTRRKPILSMPGSLLMALQPITRLIPGFPKITAAEVRRLTENRCFSIEDMTKILHVRPRSLEDGLETLFNPDLRPF